MDGGQCSMFWFSFIGWPKVLSYRVTARAFDAKSPKSTVCRVVHRVSSDICRCKGKVISFPAASMLGDIGRGFGQLAQHDAFNNAVGAIDGCHIRIKRPRYNQYDYFNYKQFYSVQVQAICDSSGRFIDILSLVMEALFSHYSLTRVLRNSPIYVHSLYPPTWLFSFGRWRLPMSCTLHHHHHTLQTPTTGEDAGAL